MSFTAMADTKPGLGSLRETHGDASESFFTPQVLVVIVNFIAITRNIDLQGVTNKQTGKSKRYCILTLTPCGVAAMF